MRSARSGTVTEARQEQDLIARAAGGDVDAFAELIEAYDRPHRALAYRLLGDRDRMDDALQEAYVKAFRFLGGFSGDSIGPWLYRIVYNACMDELRRNRVLHLPLEDAADRADPAPDPSETAAHRHDLAAAIASLSPGHRAVVLLVDAEGLDYDAAAEALGIPPGTVASRLARARAALRLVLRDGAEGAEE